jgi:hypothetical protein
MPLGGAYVGQGTTMSTNGIPWGVAVPGMGRSIYASGFEMSPIFAVDRSNRESSSDPPICVLKPFRA